MHEWFSFKCARVKCPVFIHGASSPPFGTKNPPVWNLECQKPVWWFKIKGK